MAMNVTSYSFCVSLIQTHSQEKHRAVCLICSVCIHTQAHTAHLCHTSDNRAVSIVSLSVWDTLFTHTFLIAVLLMHIIQTYSLSLCHVCMCVCTHSFTVTNSPPGQRSRTTSGFYTQSLSVIGNSHCCRHCRGSWDTTQVLSNPTLQAFMISFVSLTECTCPRQCMQQAEGWVRLL